MPVGKVGQKYDFTIAGQGFMLARPQGGQGWTRVGEPDTPGRRSATDVKFGALPDTIDHPEVWEDWSSGYGDAYRQPHRPNTVHWSENMDTRFPRQMIHCQEAQLIFSSLSGDGLTSGRGRDIDDFMEVPIQVATRAAGMGTVLTLGKGNIYSFTPTHLLSTGKGNCGSMFDTVSEYGIGANTGAREGAVFGSYSWIGLELVGAASFLRRTHAAVYTTSSIPGRGFHVAGNRLWRHFDGWYVQQVSDFSETGPLLAGAYTATLALNNAQYPINKIVDIQGQVYMGMPDGVHQGDMSGTFANILTDLAGFANTDNCNDLAVHKGQIIAPHVAGIFAFKPSSQTTVVRAIGPSTVRSNRSPIRGFPTTVRAFGEWLYAGMFTGSQSYVMAGRDTGKDQYDWHILQRLNSVCKIKRIYVDGITVASGRQVIPNRMWIATESSFGAIAGAVATAPLYVFTIPRLNDNPLGDTTFTPNYVGSARVDLGSTDFGAPGTPKVYREVEVWAENFQSGSQYCNVYYTVDSGARTLLGYAASSPKTALFFPTGSGSFVTGQAIQLSIESFTASITTTPVYRTILVRGTMRARQVDQITAMVRIADDVSDRQGGRMRPGYVQLTQLRGWKTNPEPQQLIDLTGAQSWVNILNVAEEEAYQMGQRFPEVMATVKMAVMEFSLN